MITLFEQLHDPIFRKWMTKTPTVTVQGTRPPWVVMVQKEVDGRWALARFDRYPDAYRFLTARLRNVADIALTCPRQEFKPPVVKVKTKAKLQIRLPQVEMDSPHRWCGHCRRLTQFKTYTRHPMMARLPIDPVTPRCCICGVRETLIRRYVP